MLFVIVKTYFVSNSERSGIKTTDIISRFTVVDKAPFLSTLPVSLSKSLLSYFVADKINFNVSNPILLKNHH